jgi:hypothetical protein
MNERENTARALEDKPLLPTRIGCLFGWHKWSKWSEPKNINNRLIQARACIECNQQQWNQNKI